MNVSISVFVCDISNIGKGPFLHLTHEMGVPIFVGETLQPLLLVPRAT